MTSDLQGRVPIALLPAAPVRWRRWAFNTLLATLSLPVFVYGVAEVVDLRPEARLDSNEVPYQKVRAFREREHLLDLVFVGSSRVQLGFDPGAFDRAMADHGHALESFNLGLPGMRFIESLFWVDWVLSRKPERLRWILIELQELDMDPTRKNWGTSRAVNWHSRLPTSIALQSVWASDRDAAEKRDWTIGHLRHLALRSCNLGRGLTALGTFYEAGHESWNGYEGRSAEQLRSERLERHLQGAGSEGEGATKRRVPAWVKREERQRRAEGRRNDREGSVEPDRDWRPGAGRPRRDIDPTGKSKPMAQSSAAGDGGDIDENSIVLERLHSDVLAGLVQRVRASGVEPVFVLGPGGAGKPPLVDFYELEADARQLLFERERLEPMLLTRARAREPGVRSADLFADKIHLSDLGAELFGEVLAEEFARMIDEERD